MQLAMLRVTPVFYCGRRPTEKQNRQRPMRLRFGTSFLRTESASTRAAEASKGYVSCGSHQVSFPCDSWPIVSPLIAEANIKNRHLSRQGIKLIDRPAGKQERRITATRLAKPEVALRSFETRRRAAGWFRREHEFPLFHLPLSSLTPRQLLS